MPQSRPQAPPSRGAVTIRDVVGTIRDCYPTREWRSDNGHVTGTTLTNTQKSHLFHSLLHVFHGVGGDEGVQRLVFSRQHLAVFPAHLAFLHRTLAPDHDLGTALLLNVLQRVATGGQKNPKYESLDSLAATSNHVVNDNHLWTRRAVVVALLYLII